MQVQLPRLTDGRRAGLLAAVAVYPLTRIAGTIPRPALDRAIVSGAGMALAYAAATSTTNVVRDLVAAPDVFHRLGGPHPEEAGRQYQHLDVAGAVADIGEVVDQLRVLGATKVGVTGFCMGGRLTYETAISGIDVQCAVPFYGGGIAQRLGAPTCPTLLLFGGRDDYIPTDDIEAVRAHHPDDTVVYPEAGHGFFRDGSDSYDEAAAADAWHRLTGMLHAPLA